VADDTRTKVVTTVTSSRILTRIATKINRSKVRGRLKMSKLPVFSRLQGLFWWILLATGKGIKISFSASCWETATKFYFDD
jgi:hypothetical protein